MENSIEFQRFLAFEGLFSWACATAEQVDRIDQAKEATAIASRLDANARRKCISAVGRECHYFAVAAWNLIKHRQWIQKFDILNNFDFTEIDAFNRQDLKDARDMKEHVIEYFEGRGNFRERWVYFGEKGSADASSLSGNLIGGRLDYKLFGAACARLVERLEKEPIPYPPHRTM